MSFSSELESNQIKFANQFIDNFLLPLAQAQMLKPEYIEVLLHAFQKDHAQEPGINISITLIYDQARQRQQGETLADTETHEPQFSLEELSVVVGLLQQLQDRSE